MTRAFALGALFAMASVVPAAAGKVDSGVRGTVTLGPTAPVCRVDKPCSRPYATRIVVRNARTGQRVSVVHSDQQGRFRVRLRPGRYRLRAMGDRPFPSCQEVTARVHRHRFKQVSIDCDTGIR